MDVLSLFKAMVQEDALDQHNLYGNITLDQDPNSISILTKIEACINVQHNSDKGGCPIKKTKPSLIELQETGIMTAQVEHLDNKHFVINTASFHDPFQHHMVSQINLPQLSDADMVQCAAEGLENWGRNHFVFENPYAAADDNNNDGEEEDNTDNIN
ncbi:hypothetical protein MJO29_002128 [Puccinia striiformis f. sp. tritici]|uniref:hypothetical protein n=1 Tax=Puccinia striiformis f. sp. tritici TaxID=168172 RepID=UPI002007A122|nr:hypothetical protein Pst134EA_002705 [Puccinia striiformis f. sp. tritici]KAH9472079.1 hypothetical protein Pst134EA_002705 [Puccinia striiformis f. sp. tritici]KAI7966380.1 hypothetical protein MJO29_002128 [Puccinia striiformis f. sp. tritici]